jgi:hypothetical protein
MADAEFATSLKNAFCLSQTVIINIELQVYEEFYTSVPEKFCRSA